MSESNNINSPIEDNENAEKETSELAFTFAAVESKNNGPESHLDNVSGEEDNELSEHEEGDKDNELLHALVEQNIPPVIYPGIITPNPDFMINQIEGINDNNKQSENEPTEINISIP